MDQEDVIEFGLFRLWPAHRLLMRDGAPVPLGDRALDVLLALVDEAPGIVGNGRLIERVWPGLFVQEANLRVQITQLRTALGDGVDGQRYITNIHGRGYCFAAPVTRSIAKAKADVSPSGTNLQHSPTTLIGRDTELAEVQARLTQHRLVTLLGPGGVGKTRLAVELGRRMLPDFPAGVWLVDLAPLTEPEAVVRATASVVGATLGKDAKAVEAIAAALGRKPRLLIFDNCEYLAVAAAELVQALLERVPALSILTTSQQTLQLAAEQVYPLPPLAVPPVGVQEIGSFAAIELFVERARAADASFELDSQSRTGVAEICRRLDGLPLALEMAAARLRLLGVGGLTAALDDRLKLLKGSQRHASLRGMVEWSHGLLGPADQRLFQRLAVFRGSFTLDAIVAVGGDRDMGYWEVVDALGRLVDTSLVTIDWGTPPRYRLLETLRIFAGEKLSESGERDEAAARHASYLTDVFDRADLDYETTDDGCWGVLLRPEVDNLRAALDWALAEPGRRPIALALGGAGLRLFYESFLMAEGLQYFETLVALIEPETHPALAAGILWRARFYERNMPVTTMLAYTERAVSLYRDLGDRNKMGAALAVTGFLKMQQGRYAQAKADFAEASELLEHGNFKRWRVLLLSFIGLNALQTDDIEEGRSCFTRMLDIAPKSSTSASRATRFLALAEYQAGNLDRAIELGREVVSVTRTATSTVLALDLTNLAAFLLAKGDVEEARTCLEEEFALASASGSTDLSELQVWAVLGSFEGRLADAARLIGFVDAERVRVAQPRQRANQRLYGELSRRLEEGLAAAELTALREEGANWTRAEAAQFVESRLLSQG